MKSVLATLLLFGGAFSNCGDGVSQEWQRFNGFDDRLSVEISPEAEGSEPLAADIKSTTGETVIGEMRIVPGGGPVGTEFRVVVSVGATWDDDVGRADLEIETGSRGTRTLSMDQDSADDGTWVLDLRAFGEIGEVRTDTFRVKLYELVEVVEADDPDVTVILDDTSG